MGLYTDVIEEVGVYVYIYVERQGDCYEWDLEEWIGPKTYVYYQPLVVSYLDCPTESPMFRKQLHITCTVSNTDQYYAEANMYSW